MKEKCSVPDSRPWFSSLGDLDRVGEKFSDTPRNIEYLEKVQQYRAFRMLCLTTTIRVVENLIESFLFPVMVSIRIKRLNSIVRKIRREKTSFSLGRMDDIVGVRIICPSYAVARAFSKQASARPDVKTKDYINERHPKGTGYRSTHHILRFPQSLSESQSVDVRFEIQIRSYLQHRWALWSEANGEEVKAGHVSEKIKSELLAMSKKIAKWEETNPEKIQRDVFYRLPYVGRKNLVVARRLKNAEPLIERFEETEDAARYLSYQEMQDFAKMSDMLLLVGVSSVKNALAVLRETHPLYTTQSRVTPPELYIPK